jgi:hypothetical protein
VPAGRLTSGLATPPASTAGLEPATPRSGVVRDVTTNEAISTTPSRPRLTLGGEPTSSSWGTKLTTVPTPMVTKMLRRNGTVW